MKEVVVATLNTNVDRQKFFTSPDGLSDAAGPADVLLFQETGPRKAVEDALRESGFRVAHAALKGLAIGVKNGLHTHDERTHPLPVRFFNLGAKLGMVATKVDIPKEEGGDETDEVTFVSIHKTVATRPFTKKAQFRDLIEELKDPYYRGTVVLGGDFNHHPFFMKSYRRFLKETGFREASPDVPTFMLRRTKYWPLRLFGFPNRKMDKILIRGDGLRPESGEAIKIRSDHKGLKTIFKNTRSSG